MVEGLEIQGRRVRLPVRARDGDSLPAQFLVAAGAAQALLAPAGVEVVRALPRLILGSHAMADELRSLGLLRRPLMCLSMRGMRACVGAPVEIAR